MIVGHGVILHEDFAHNAHFRFPKLFINGQMVKFLDHGLDVFLETEVIALDDFFLGPFHPLIKQGFRRTLGDFIGHHAVTHIHERIAVHGRLDGIHEHATAHMEGICFLLESMNRKHRHLRETGMF